MKTRFTSFSGASGGTGRRAAERKADSLRRRTLSALVLAPVVLVAAWLGGWYFTALVAAAALVMAFEWDALCRVGAADLVGPVAALAVLVAIALAGGGAFVFAVVAVAAGTALVAALAGWLRRSPLWSGLGVVYIALPCIAIVWLRTAPVSGRDTIFWLLALVWATDIGAYVAGRGIGGARLAPRISPAKTWSGLAGGIVCAAVTGAIAALVTGAVQMAILAGASAVLAVVSQLGDLAESAIKRRFGAGDAGRLIPGHGGVLDRVDGLLFASLAVCGLTLIRGETPLVWS